MKSNSWTVYIHKQSSMEKVLEMLNDADETRQKSAYPKQNQRRNGTRKIVVNYFAKGKKTTLKCAKSLLTCD